MAHIYELALVKQAPLDRQHTGDPVTVRQDLPEQCLCIRT